MSQSCDRSRSHRCLCCSSRSIMTTAILHLIREFFCCRVLKVIKAWHNHTFRSSLGPGASQGS